MRIETDIKLDFRDVLIRPKRSTLKTRAEVSLTRAFSFKYATGSRTFVPIIASNMDHTGTLAMARALASQQMLTALDKFLTDENWQLFQADVPLMAAHCFISAGSKPEDIQKLKRTLERIPSAMICLDVANGYTESFVDVVKSIREQYPEKVIMAGNVVTGEMTEELILSGADIVKIGIGPGSVCTTRMKTGVGYPQLSAIIECADAAHGLKGHVCADGGCTVPGDIAKAFAAGADFVMLGGMLAGHDECSGEIFKQQDQSFKRFYGMSSEEAMQKHFGSKADYRASEGKSVNVPYRGPVSHTILDILGGLRSACTYVGAQQLKELPKRTTFIRVNMQLNDIFTPYQART